MKDDSLNINIDTKRYQLFKDVVSRVKALWLENYVTMPVFY